MSEIEHYMRAVQEQRARIARIEAYIKRSRIPAPAIYTPAKDQDSYNIGFNAALTEIERIIHDDC